MTIKEQDLAQAKEEALIAHQQLRLLVTELESLQPSMACLQMPCTTCKRVYKTNHLKRKNMKATAARSQVVVVGSPQRGVSTELSGDGNVTESQTGFGELEADDAEGGEGGGSPTRGSWAGERSVAMGTRTLRAASYWVQPWATPSIMGVDSLASALERIAESDGGAAAAGAATGSPTAAAAAPAATTTGCLCLVSDCLPAPIERLPPRAFHGAGTGIGAGGGGGRLHNNNRPPSSSVSDAADAAEEAAKPDPEVYVDSYTLALKLAKVGAPPQRAKQIAAIFGERQSSRGGPLSLPALNRGRGGRPSSQMSQMSQMSAGRHDDLAYHAAARHRQRAEPALAATQQQPGQLAVVEVVSRAAFELGVAAEPADGGPTGTVAATLERCIAQLGLTEASGEADTLRDRAALVAKQLGIDTGW